MTNLGPSKYKRKINTPEHNNRIPKFQKKALETLNWKIHNFIIQSTMNHTSDTWHVMTLVVAHTGTVLVCL